MKVIRNDHNLSTEEINRNLWCFGLFFYSNYQFIEMLILVFSGFMHNYFNLGLNLFSV